MADETQSTDQIGPFPLSAVLADDIMRARIPQIAFTNGEYGMPADYQLLQAKLWDQLRTHHDIGDVLMDNDDEIVLVNTFEWQENTVWIFIQKQYLIMDQ